MNSSGIWSISEHQMDVIRELFTLGAGKAADILNTYLSSHIELKIPSIKITSCKQLAENLPYPQSEEYSSVEMGLSQSLQGTAELIFLSKGASILVNAITGTDDYESKFDELKAATYSEIGNIIINAVLGTIMNELKLTMTFSIPYFHHGTIGERGLLDDDSVVLQAAIDFFVETLSITGSIFFFLNAGSFDTFLSSIDIFINQL